MDKKDMQIRAALADYIASEGCGCCENGTEHKIAEIILAKLLNVEILHDGASIPNFD